MHRPSPWRLLWLFARTAVRRFANRFIFLKQKKAEARRKKLGLPEPMRAATAHRNQGFRAGSVLVWLFMAYMMAAFVMMMNTSFQRAMFGVLEFRQPAPPPATASPEESQRSETNKRKRNDFMGGNALEHMNPATRRTADKVNGLLMLTAGVGTLLFAIGVLSRQVSRPEPSLAWLFEFPVPRPVLFTSKMSECLFDGASLPLLSMLPGIALFHAGFGFWASAGWGLAFGLIITLAIAGLRIAVEVLLLQKCPRRRRGTIGGVCAAAGTLLMVVVLYGGGTPSLLRVLLAAADRLPDWFFWNPFCAGFGAPLTNPAAQWLGATTVALGLCTASVFLCSRLTRFGLEPGLESARGAAPAGAVPAQGKQSLFSGLVGKEMLMLVRQRTVMVQVLLAPIIMVLMMYFQSSGRLAEKTLGSGPALASAIYGIGAYMVLIASQVAMNTELRTLWLLLSLPRPLADSLRAKSIIWGAAAAGIVLLLMVSAMVARPDFAGGLAMRLPFIVVLVALVADLCVGFRTMGSSIISETTVHFRQWAAWLPLMLSAAAGQAVFSGDVWALCVQVVLLGALDVSVWQKLNAELPWLTEPAEGPPARLYLMHGLLAVYALFVLRGLGLLLAGVLKVPPAALLPAAGAIAAAIVAILAYWQLGRKRIRILPERAAAPVRTLTLTLAGALVTVAAAFLWIKLLAGFASTSKWLEQMRAALPQPDDTSGWIVTVLLAAAVTPVCEEFIFRGLVYQGLRRMCGVAASIVWSSLLFAVVQPVGFCGAGAVMAAVSAFVMERTGRLTASAVIHGVYGGFLLWFLVAAS